MEWWELVGSVTVTNEKKEGTQPSKGSKVIFIGRPTIFGNPTQMSQKTSRAQAIAEYRSFFDTCYATKGSLYKRVNELADMVKCGDNISLQCYCAPKPCHGDIIKTKIIEIIIGEEHK